MSLPDEPAWMRPNGPGWRHHSERLIYETPWISVHDFDAEAPTGARTVYGVVRYKNLAIGILPIFDDGSIVLVGQHRFPLRDYRQAIRTALETGRHRSVKTVFDLTGGPKKGQDP